MDKKQLKRVALEFHAFVTDSIDDGMAAEMGIETNEQALNFLETCLETFRDHTSMAEGEKKSKE